MEGPVHGSIRNAVKLEKKNGENTLYVNNFFMSN